MITITIESTNSADKVQLSDELEAGLQSYVTRALDGRDDPTATVSKLLLDQFTPLLKRVAEEFPSSAVQAAKADLEVAQANLDAAKAAAVTKVPVDPKDAVTPINPAILR